MSEGDIIRMSEELLSLLEADKLSRVRELQRKAAEMEALTPQQFLMREGLDRYCGDILLARMTREGWRSLDYREGFWYAFSATMESKVPEHLVIEVLEGRRRACR